MHRITYIHCQIIAGGYFKHLQTIQVVLSETWKDQRGTEGRHLQPFEDISSRMLGKTQGTRREVTGEGHHRINIFSEVQSRHGTAQKQQAVNRCQRTRHFGPWDLRCDQVIVVTVAVQPLYTIFRWFGHVRCNHKLGCYMKWPFYSLLGWWNPVQNSRCMIYVRIWDDLANPCSWGKTPEDWWGRGGRRRGGFCRFGG